MSNKKQKKALLKVLGLTKDSTVTEIRPIKFAVRVRTPTSSGSTLTWHHVEISE